MKPSVLLGSTSWGMGIDWLTMMRTILKTSRECCYAMKLHEDVVVTPAKALGTVA